jgi:hypothetical protein
LFGVVTVVTLLVAFVVIAPAARFSAFCKRFPIGTSLQQVQSVLTNSTPVQTRGVVSVEGTLEEKEKLTYAFYVIHAADEGAYLEFNYYKELIDIRPTKSVFHVAYRKLSKTQAPRPTGNVR